MPQIYCSSIFLVGDPYGLYHAVPSRIAINMILSCAAGGTVAVAVACWAQLRYRTDSVNANEIANGILSCLVAITAGCPFVSYWAACLIGSELITIASSILPTKCIVTTLLQ